MSWFWKFELAHKIILATICMFLVWKGKLIFSASLGAKFSLKITCFFSNNCLSDCVWLGFGNQIWSQINQHDIGFNVWVHLSADMSQTWVKWPFLHRIPAKQQQITICDFEEKNLKNGFRYIFHNIQGVWYHIYGK